MQKRKKTKIIKELKQIKEPDNYKFRFIAMKNGMTQQTITNMWYEVNV